MRDETNRPMPLLSVLLLIAVALAGGRMVRNITEAMHLMAHGPAGPARLTQGPEGR